MRDLRTRTMTTGPRWRVHQSLLDCDGGTSRVGLLRLVSDFSLLFTHQRESL